MDKFFNKNLKIRINNENKASVCRYLREHREQFKWNV